MTKLNIKFMHKLYYMYKLSNFMPQIRNLLRELSHTLGFKHEI